MENYFAKEYDRRVYEKISSMTEDEKHSLYHLASSAISGDHSAIDALNKAFPDSPHGLSLFWQVSQMCIGSLTKTELNVGIDQDTRDLNVLSAGGTPAARPLPPLLKLRAAAGLTQKQLSEKSGVSVGQISRVERGYIISSNMTLANAAALANALGCHAEDLL